MKCVHEIYQNILENGTWKYYRRSICLYSIEELFYEESKAFEWIKSVFRDGEKLCVFNGTFHNAPPLYERMKHSISVFLFGIYLAAQSAELTKQLEQLEEQQGVSWKYFWFVTCLYHDYGYIVENDKKSYPITLDLTRLTEILHIDSSILYDLKYDNLDMSANEILAYYNYNRNMGEKSFINHGIVGGICLYHELKRNLEEIIRERNYADANFDKTNFTHNGLHYSISHTKWYKLCAESIILHNIWPASTRENKTTYRRNNLKKICRTKKLWYDNPITNLLILADTLEPCKRIGAKFLEDIQIDDSENNTIKIIIPTYLLQEENNETYGKYKADIIKLSNWFNIKSRKYTGKKHFSIKFQLH